MSKKDPEELFDHVVEIYSSFHWLLDKRAREAESKWKPGSWNRAVAWRLALGIFSWKHLFIPIGIAQGDRYWKTADPGYYRHVIWRELYIFGFRFAMWVTSANIVLDENAKAEAEAEAQVKAEEGMKSEVGTEDISEAKAEIGKPEEPPG